MEPAAFVFKQDCADGKESSQMELPHNDFREVGKYIDHPAQARPGIKVFPDRLNVVTVVQNPVRFRSRYELYRKFEKHMHESGVNLLTVEIAFGKREFEVAEENNPWHLRLRSHYMQELWLKEAGLMLGIHRLEQIVPRWNKVAWIDADVTFMRTDWAQETMHQLEHYEVVQCFVNAYDMDQIGRVMEIHQSFGYSFCTGAPEPPDGGDKGGYAYHIPGPGINGSFWHPGFAWAARRSFFQKTGGLVDWSGLGAGDMIMAKAIIGKVEQSYHGDVSAGFKRQAKLFQYRCRDLHKNFGYVPGSIYHGFHGHKAHRNYVSRWGHLTAGEEPGVGAKDLANIYKFNPETDLIRDHQGLYQLHPKRIRVRDGFRTYFRSRMEDADFFN